MHAPGRGLVFVSAAFASGCQLVDPPSDINGGRRDGGTTMVDGSTGDASQSQILCNEEAGVPYCPPGTMTCCYFDPQGAGVCGDDSCNSQFKFHCSSFADCAPSEVCCSAMTDVQAEGGAFAALEGSSCVDADACASSPLFIVCGPTESSLCPAGTTCTDWGSVPGGRYPLGYRVCCAGGACP